MEERTKTVRTGGRQRSRSVSGRVLVAALLLAAVVAGGLGALVWALLDQRAAQRDAVHTGAVMAAARGLEASAVDLETGSRGFAISADPAFLTPLRAASLRIPAQIDGLRALARDAGQRVQVERLARLIEDYQSKWSTPVVEMARRDPAAARETIASGGGRRHMDRIRAGFAEFLVAERTAAGRRHERSEEAADRALAMGLACAIGSALLILGFAAYLRGTVVRPIRRVTAAGSVSQRAIAALAPRPAVRPSSTCSRAPSTRWRPPWRPRAPSGSGCRRSCVSAATNSEPWPRAPRTWSRASMPGCASSMSTAP